MSKKWMKVDPTTLKVGDRFKAVKIRGDHSKIVATGVVEDNDFECFGIRQGQPPAALHPLLYDTTSCHWFIDNYQWYIRSNEPKKAKPEPDLVEGHDAKFWFCRWEKQLNHNEQLQAANSGRRVKMQRLEKEVKDARKDAQYWQNKYAVLAASANDLPEKPKPLTRPDEPPVGSFFRVDRTGREFYRYPQVSLTHYFHLACDAGDRPWVAWADVTIPGDTITLLYLREVPND